MKKFVMTVMIAATLPLATMADDCRPYYKHATLRAKAKAIDNYRYSKESEADIRYGESHVARTSTEKIGRVGLGTALGCVGGGIVGGIFSIGLSGTVPGCKVGATVGGGYTISTNNPERDVNPADLPELRKLPQHYKAAGQRLEKLKESYKEVLYMYEEAYSWRAGEPNEKYYFLNKLLQKIRNVDPAVENSVGILVHYLLNDSRYSCSEYTAGEDGSNLMSKDLTDYYLALELGVILDVE